jgi:ATP-dependent DNA ligase
MIARRNGDRARVFTRRGFDWSERYPVIVEALRSLRVNSVTIDGEAAAGGTVPLPLPDGRTVTVGRAEFDTLLDRPRKRAWVTIRRNAPMPSQR